MRNRAIALLATGVLTAAGGVARADLQYSSDLVGNDMSVTYGRWLGFTCSSGQCTSAQQTVTVPTGFAVADMVLTGLEMNATDSSTHPLWRMGVSLVPESYASASGEFKWHLVTEINDASATAESYSVDVYFAILLVDQSDIVLTDASVSCNSAVGSCSANHTDFGSVPGAQLFGGYAFRSVSFATPTTSPSFSLLHMTQDVSVWNKVLQDTTVTYSCDFNNGSNNNSIACGADIVGIAVPTWYTPGTICDGPGAANSRVAVDDSRTGGGGHVGSYMGMSLFDLKFMHSHDIWRWDAGYIGRAANGGLITYSQAADEIYYVYSAFLGNVADSLSSDDFYWKDCSLKIFFF